MSRLTVESIRISLTKFKSLPRGLPKVSEDICKGATRDMLMAEIQWRSSWAYIRLSLCLGWKSLCFHHTWRVGVHVGAGMNRNSLRD